MTADSCRFKAGMGIGNMKKRKFYTTKELATILGKNVDTIRRWDRQERFPFRGKQLKSGNFVYPADEVDKWIKGGAELLRGNGLPSHSYTKATVLCVDDHIYVYVPGNRSYAAKFNKGEETAARQWADNYNSKTMEEDSNEQEQLEMPDSDLQEEIAQLREQLVKEHNLYLEEKKKNAFREAQFDSIMGYLEKIVDITGREP